VLLARSLLTLSGELPFFLVLMTTVLVFQPAPLLPDSDE